VGFVHPSCGTRDVDRLGGGVFGRLLHDG
jgi:hypothetical protein